MLLFLQDWDDYGIDWGGPVPHDHHDNGVVIEDVGEILSMEQRSELEEEMNENNPLCSIAEDVLVHQYSAAKQYVELAML